MIHNGTERNWEIVGLTPDNYLRMRNTETGEVCDTHERPSEYWGITYLTRVERGILRRGLTPAGRDRHSPKR